MGSVWPVEVRPGGDPAVSIENNGESCLKPVCQLLRIGRCRHREPATDRRRHGFGEPIRCAREAGRRGGSEGLVPDLQLLTSRELIEAHGINWCGDLAVDDPAAIASRRRHGCRGTTTRNRPIDGSIGREQRHPRLAVRSAGE
jgi:hypothetical protein